MQDIEFTVEDGTLYMLQTRSGKRTGTAAVRIAVEMVKEGLIDETTAIKRVSPESLNHLFMPQIDPKKRHTVKPVAQGISASPGAAVGKVVLSAEEAVKEAAKDPKARLMLVPQGDQPGGRRRDASWHKGSSHRPAARRATRRSSPAGGESRAWSAARRSGSMRRPARSRSRARRSRRATT